MHAYVHILSIDKWFYAAKSPIYHMSSILNVFAIFLGISSRVLGKSNSYFYSGYCP